MASLPDSTERCFAATCWRDIKIQPLEARRGMSASLQTLVKSILTTWLPGREACMLDSRARGLHISRISMPHPSQLRDLGARQLHWTNRRNRNGWNPHTAKTALSDLAHEPPRMRQTPAAPSSGATCPVWGFGHVEHGAAPRSGRC